MPIAGQSVVSSASSSTPGQVDPRRGAVGAVE